MLVSGDCGYGDLLSCITSNGVCFLATGNMEYEDICRWRANGADRQTEEAGAAVAVHVVRTEVAAPRVVRVRIERRRHVVADGAGIVEARVVAIPRGGEKNGITIGLACYLVAVYAFLRSPRPCAVL